LEDYREKITTYIGNRDHIIVIRVFKSGRNGAQTCARPNSCGKSRGKST
jgi:hypothetical protein